jgi:hypothetical protein
MLGVFSFNGRALAAYRKIGCRREARIIAGKAHEVMMIDLLEYEFRKSWPSNLVGWVSGFG